MIFGYTRTISPTEDLSVDLKLLKESGCYWVFSDINTTLKKKLYERKRLSHHVSYGDTIRVNSLPRLGSSIEDIVRFASKMEGVTIDSIQDELVVSTENLAIWLKASETLRKSLISSKTRFAMHTAKNEGKKLGRRKGLDPTTLQRISVLESTGHSSKPLSQRCVEVGVSRSTYPSMARAFEKENCRLPVASDGYHGGLWPI